MRKGFVVRKGKKTYTDEDIRNLHWMARRYADGRQSYATGLFNDITRRLLESGVRLNPTADETVWARDGQGRNCDGLADAEAMPGTPEALGSVKKENAKFNGFRKKS